MNRKYPSYYWLTLAVILALIAVIALSFDRSDAQAPARGSAPRVALHPRGADVTTLVQTRLHQFGYTIAIDGQYGPQTTRVVALWQKANGLTVDGIAGPQTLKTLGPISFAAAVPSPAVRSSPPAHPSSVGSESVETIIRNVWPDDLEDWAVAIATRESRLVPAAVNSCCYGLFQLNWIAHHAWMTSDFGITDPKQLFDPRLNAEVALHLYQQTGPGPWNL